MRFDLNPALEGAAWPVIVLSNTGLLVHGNRAAVSVLGPIFETGKAELAASWAPDNTITFQGFLTQITSLERPSQLLKLRDQQGRPILFQAQLSSLSKEPEPLALIQLFPAPSASPAPVAKGEPPKAPAPAVGPNADSTAAVQKLECALQLTRTVALDFNNALTSILGHVSHILSRMETSHPWRNSLLEIEKSAEKAAEVASDLAAFSRPEKEAPSQVAGNLNDILRRTVEAFQAPGARPMHWKLRLEQKLYTVIYDEAKMQQAFAKILDNAIQASADGSQISVQTRNHELERPVQEGTVRLAAGSYVCVEFEDAGCGIPAEVLPRIFEPFFTTKSSPHHRGLGLAWVYGIVTNHGGSVGVSSEVGRGTAVRVYLPAQKKFVRDRFMDTGDLSGKETILLVDDEELLLTMGEMVLSSFGYRVLTAGSGLRGLELFREHANEIDLVITDLVMPRMSGRELIEQLRLISPGLKIICTSGYIRALTAEDEELYLQKPFTSLDLLRKVRQVLVHSDAS
jgi:signal transduction histidine kinase/CheY-like chemotaxis protein